MLMFFFSFYFFLGYTLDAGRGNGIEYEYFIYSIKINHFVCLKLMVSYFTVSPSAAATTLCFLLFLSVNGNLSKGRHVSEIYDKKFSINSFLF